MKIQTLYKLKKRVTIHTTNRNLTNHRLPMIKKTNQFLASRAMTTRTEETLSMVNNMVKVEFMQMMTSMILTVHMPREAQSVTMSQIIITTATSTRPIFTIITVVALHRTTLWLIYPSTHNFGIRSTWLKQTL